MPLRLQFQPEGCTWQGDAPSPLAMAAAECGILLEQPCGGKGVCGKCLVRSLDGAIAAGPADLRALGEAAVAEGWRLACRATVGEDAVVEVPAGSRMVARKSFGADELPGAGFQPRFPGGGWGLALDL